MCLGQRQKNYSYVPERVRGSPSQLSCVCAYLQRRLNASPSESFGFVPTDHAVAHVLAHVSVFLDQQRGLVQIWSWEAAYLHCLGQVRTWADQCKIHLYRLQGWRSDGTAVPAKPEYASRFKELYW